MKFSIIIPVYNVEKYIGKCLESVVNQTFDDFEAIVVNDGSPDNSQAIIDEYVKQYPDKIKSFTKENGGLSDARNFGIEKASGEYLLFIDSDDYIDEKTLKSINAEIEHYAPDIIGFNIITVNQDYERIELISKPSFSNITGEDAIISLVDCKVSFEPAWSFAYRTEYWKSHDFQFMKGIYHEDYALIPLVILRAKSVSCLDFNGYYYVSTDNSITRTNTDERKQRLVFDLLKGYDFLVEEFYKKPTANKYAGEMYLAYAANAAIYRLETLNGDLKKKFRKELQKRKISKHIINNTVKRKIRKLIIRLKNRI